jgi:hypothetical protein
MNREEFKTYVLEQVPHYAECGLLDDGEPFWIPEFAENRKCKVFVETKDFSWWALVNDSRDEFYKWNKKHLSKKPLCFVSDSEHHREWWGFENEQDAVLFVMRWS